MSTMAGTSEELDRILYNPQGCLLDRNICEKIVKVLNCSTDFKPKSIQKLLEICLQDPKDDVEYATDTLKVVSVVLKKVAAGEFSIKPDLVPSMLDLLFMMNTSIYSSKSDDMKIMYFKTLLSYPDEVYCNLEDNDKILEVFKLYAHQLSPLELRVQPIHVLFKYLKVLPPPKRLKFVEQGINVWFVTLVPLVIFFAKIPDFEIETPLAALELIVDECSSIDYYDDPSFQSLYESQKYPTIMKNLLAKGSTIWHRLWIIFIKLFKNQLTKSGSYGSPINSMLPVVETAFKLDVTNRCRAFICWNALIDNFASEANEAYVNKRIKLLVIPLYSNNAKVEQTVIAKTNTWWHLICRYSKLSNFAEILLIPFLQFCFGKPNDCDKPVQRAGMLTDMSRVCCVEALVNIFGHNNCQGCVSLPVLKDKVLNDKCLIASKKDLLYSMNAAIRIVATNSSKLRLPYKCAWMSFIKLICDTTDDNLRRNLFNDLLAMIENLIQNIHEDIIADIVLNDLIFNLLQGDEKILHLLYSTDKNDSKIQHIFFMLLNPSFENAYVRNDMSTAIENFKPFTDYIVQHCLHNTIIEAFLKQLSSNYKSLVLWTAISSSICAKKCDTSPEILNAMLLWPLKYLDLLCNVEFSTSMWLTLFDFVDVKLGVSYITNGLIEVLNDLKKHETITLPFLLNAAIYLLSKKMTASNGMKYSVEVLLMYTIVNKFVGLNHTDTVFSKLLDILLELFKNLFKYTNLSIAKKVFIILKFVLSILHNTFEKSIEVDAVLLGKIEQVLQFVQDLLQLEAYAVLKQFVLTEFLHYAISFGKQKLLKNAVLDMLQTLLKRLDKNHPSLITIKNIMTILNEDSNQTVPMDKPKFTTPTNKKGKKKETSIVNTVVENGEEFVVVKSNWKFNPKKLTENQKEKFKRKREDIPALYQDLSQSQDDFKLSTWKTDSQDTTATSTSSKSNDLATSEKVSSILKNMANTDVVPKILKNIFTESNEKISSSLELTNENMNEIQTPISIKVKPRLSLKDRITRNVKMLSEKSDGKIDEKHLNAAIDNATPQLKTPVGVGIKISDVNSEPPEINAERPSRLKRIPKKFEEMEIFSAKKRRPSLYNSDSQNKDSCEDLNGCQVVTGNSKVKEIFSVKKRRHSDSQNKDLCEDLNDYQDVTKNSKVKEIFSVKKWRHSLYNSDSQNKHSCEDLNDCQVVTENSNVEEIKLNALDADVYKKSEGEEIKSNTSDEDVSKNQESDRNILVPDLPGDKTKHKDTQCTNNLNVVHNQIVQHENINNQQNSKSNVAPEISEIDVEIATTDKNQTDHKHVSKEDQSITPLNKKSSKRKSRIEKELAIDTVEGHPFLKVQTEKRLTRRKALESPVVSRGKSQTQKLNKSKTEKKNTSKVDKKIKEIDKQLDKSREFDTFADTQESTVTDENGSQDIIESSQDSTVSIMSVKSTKTPNRMPVITLEHIDHKVLANEAAQSSKSICADSKTVNDTENCNNDDNEFPLNKTAEEHVQIDLTENLDTQSVDTDHLIPGEVIVINDEEPIANNLDGTYIDMDTQDIADADTQPMDSDTIITKELENITSNDETKSLDASKLQEHVMDSIPIIDTSPSRTQEETTRSLTESLLCAPETKQDESLTKLSPKDEEQRKQDFLDNTLEISPIKTLSPVRDDKSPTPETSSDFVVIKLSSPVQSNGEPFEKCDSPEIFTEEKVSPDKRDQSPSREDTRVTTASPRSLSLKKNKPQVRSGGRAAQMLGLCIPDPHGLQTKINSEKSVEAEEVKKCSPQNSSARRNLRKLYNSTNDNSETSEEAKESRESSNFLMMKRSLPAADSSPSVPILKRKLADIVDDSTVSPANKRKRVSFHDPPVSTTVCVKNYIESGSVRSPQNSATKRQERRTLKSKLEAGGNLKSPKRLDTVFKLDTALIKAVESFSEANVAPSASEDTEMSSLEPTPLVEVVKNSELNDVDPICLELVDCKDPVDNIAGDLSSSAMRPLLVKEFAGKIDTVGDLAKLSELEVNRLCIKAPKVQVAKKVLTEYAKKINTIANEMTPMTEAAFSESTVLESKAVDVEMQKDYEGVESVEMKTEALAVSVASTKTNTAFTVECDEQTDESGSKSTEDIAKSLLEKPDFSDHLNKLLDVPSMHSIASSWPIGVLTDILVQKMQNETYSTNEIIDKLLEKQTDSTNGQNHNQILSLYRQSFIKHFNSNELFHHCIDLLKEVHDSRI